MTLTITTTSGATKALPAHIDAGIVAGLDSRGRIVVDHFGARTKPLPETYTFATAPFLFGLTLCCNASDKGVEGGVVCRGCYGEDETGAYLYRNEDGTFMDLDPATCIG